MVSMTTQYKKKVRKTGQRPKIIRKPRKVRLAIQCSPEERKYMKMLAAHEDKTLNQFVLECVRMRIYKCLDSHIPNRETKAALKAAEQKEDLIHFDSIENFFKSMER